jgi:hypothetical protein
LIQEARELFTGIVEFEEALRDIGQRYLYHNDGKIGFLLSATRAKHTRNKHPLGSELIRGLANRLGGEARIRLAVTGTPTIIKCILHTDWLDKDTTFPVREVYVKNILWALIRLQWWPSEVIEGFEGGFLLTRPVPPENILEFIDMSEFLTERTHVQSSRRDCQ